MAVGKQKPVVQQAQVLAQLLSDEFPVWRDYKPLKVGVIGDLHDWIVANDLSFSRRCVHYCLRYHVESYSYLSGLKQGLSRSDLNGLVVGVVSEKEALHAKSLISHKYS